MPHSPSLRSGRSQDCSLTLLKRGGGELHNFHILHTIPIDITLLSIPKIKVAVHKTYVCFLLCKIHPRGVGVATPIHKVLVAKC